MFDFKNELREIERIWRDFCLGRLTGNAKKEFAICGLKGSGKTEIIRKLVQSHSYAFYFSFENLTDKTALEAFRGQFAPEFEPFENWDDAVKAFADKRADKPTMLIFDNNKSVYYRAFKHLAVKTDNIQICSMLDSITESTPEPFVTVNYRTLRDYFNAFPNYTRQEILRLYAMTGGIYSVAKELDGDISFEENLKNLLEYDSAFSTVLPMRLTETFRAPESYYPILNSIAYGHNRLAEIAKDIEFPNNKCGKYLEALIKNNFVYARKNDGGKQSTYHLANPYFIAWARFILGNKSLQINDPDTLFRYVMSVIDKIALTAFYGACERFIGNAPRDYLNRYRSTETVLEKRSVSVELSDGTKVKIICRSCLHDESYVFVLPQSVDARFTKAGIDDIYEKLKDLDMYYNTHITIFSVNRFSDWCVREAKLNPYLHEVTLERLKY